MGISIAKGVKFAVAGGDAQLAQHGRRKGIRRVPNHRAAEGHVARIVQPGRNVAHAVPGRGFVDRLLCRRQQNAVAVQQQ